METLSVKRANLQWYIQIVMLFMFMVFCVVQGMEDVESVEDVQDVDNIKDVNGTNVELGSLTREWIGGAHATWYGERNGSGTMGGSCGYGDLSAAGYGSLTTALSTALFNNGLSCGACFAIRCNVSASDYCYQNRVIRVTTTNFCPHGSYGGWCDDDKPHFDLSHKAFTFLAREVGGHFPVLYKRTPCYKKGGARFTMEGNENWNNVLVTNLAGEGTISSLSMKGYEDWIQMTQDWGAYWESGVNVARQALSFLLVSGSGKEFLFPDVVPGNWSFGDRYEAATNLA